MSYSIVFETKICLASNGDIIHFSRNGCNNDNAGREKDEFTAKIYTPQEWEAEIQHWESIERPEYGWDLKIGSRKCCYADYGAHLRRMTKKAIPLTEMVKQIYFTATEFTGITFYPEDGEPEEIDAKDKRVDDTIYGIWYGRIKGAYSRKCIAFNDPAEMEEAIRRKACVSFHIDTRREPEYAVYRYAC